MRGLLSVTIAFVLALSCLASPEGPWSVSDQGQETGIGVDPDTINIPGSIDMQLGGYFIENGKSGGAEEAVLSIRGGNMDVGFGEGWVAFHIFDSEEVVATVYRMYLEGAHRCTPEGTAEQDHKMNLMIGRSPSEWQLDMRSYGGVIYRSAWDGIDMRFLVEDGRLKYEFDVAPGSDPDDIALRYEGVKGLHVNDINGDLVIGTRLRNVIDKAPTGYQEVDGELQDVSVSFDLEDVTTVGFKVGPYDAALPLIIDPSLELSTFIGGGGGDFPTNVMVDDEGYIYVAGSTDHRTFPTTPGSYDTSHNMDYDAFVSKISPDATTLVWSTFVGGSASDRCNGLHVDDAKAIYIAGVTESWDFPITQGAFRSSLGSSGQGAFVTKVISNGTDLEYSTYFPAGSRLIDCWDMTVDQYGCAYIVGTSHFGEIPVTQGAYDTTANGAWDAYVAKFEANGSALNYSTYLGGGFTEWGWSVAVDEFGNAYVGGHTGSATFPTTPGAYDRSHHGANTDFEAFVTKINASGSSLDFSTFIGGSEDEGMQDICIDDDNNVYVIVTTYSADYPMRPGAIDTTIGGAYDSAVSMLDPTGSKLIYSTYLGGRDGEGDGHIFAADGSVAYIAGRTRSNDFPITSGAYDTTHNGDSDIFFSIIDLEAGDLVYSTFLGGTDMDYPSGITVIFNDTEDKVYFSGSTKSSEITVTSGVFDEVYAGNYEGLIHVFNVEKRPIWADVPEFELIEDVPFDVDFTTYVSDGDTPLHMLRVTSEHEFVTNSIGRTLTFKVPNGHTQVSIPVVLSDGLWNVPRDIILKVKEVNDPPTFDMRDEFTVTEDIPRTIDLGPYIDDVDDPVESLEVTTESPYAIVNGLNVTVTVPNGYSRYTLYINVSDGKDTTTGSINLTVIPVNDPPVIGTLPDFDAVEDESSFFNIGPLISDPDTAINELVVTTDSDSCRVEGHHLYFEYTTGGFERDVTVFVSDGLLTTNATLHVTVMEKNDPPEIAIIDRQTVTEGMETTIDLSDYVSDEDNSMNELFLECDSEYVIEIDGMAIKVLFDHWIDVQTFSISVSDGEGMGTSSFEVEVLAVNDPPVIVSVGDLDGPGMLEVLEGSKTFLDVYAIDEEGDALTWSIRSDWTRVRVSEDTKVVIDAAHGDVGTYVFFVAVSDPSGATDSWTIEVEVMNVNDPPSAPVLRAPANETIWEMGQNITFTIKVDDPDLRYGQFLTVTFESDISGDFKTMTTDGDLSFVYDGLPKGEHRITIVATDGEFTSSSWFLLTIEEPPKENRDKDDTPSGLSAALIVCILVVTSLIMYRARGRRWT